MHAKCVSSAPFFGAEWSIFRPFIVWTYFRRFADEESAALCVQQVIEKEIDRSFAFA